MGQPAAKQGDIVQAVDTHIVMVPSPGGPVPTPTPGHPFNGMINGSLSTTVRIMGMPTNQGTIITGSATVRINGQPAARNGDTANTCNDPAPLPVGTVIAVGTVMIGG
jgi:uncharacterized Zn-binding protein involved in type VI secretion